LYLASPRTQKNLSHIFAGLLKLYAILRQKEIAIRDLKAGNIFVTDDSITRGVLGLLDFETAIKYATPYASSTIPQPRLGGTPSRGTPSLWFSNEVLRNYYGELQRPLYLPDLYAIIEIIYSAVTREPLFKKGKEIIQNLFEVINGELELDYFKIKLSSLPSSTYDESTYVLETTVVNTEDEETKLDEADLREESAEYMLEVYKIVNNIYWESVFVEFQEAIKKHKYLLEQIEIPLPPEFIATLKKEIELNCRLLEIQLQQSDNFREIRQKKLDRQRMILQDSLKTANVHKLLQLLFMTVALFMNRIS
jgi:serine/threonine protein kinase